MEPRAVTATCKRHSSYLKYSYSYSYLYQTVSIVQVFCSELCADELMVGGDVLPSYDRRRRRADPFSPAAAAWALRSVAAASAASVPNITRFWRRAANKKLAVCFASVVALLGVFCPIIIFWTRIKFYFFK